MKKTFVFLLVFIFVFSLNVYASDNDAIVSFNNEDNAFVVYTADNIESSDETIFGISKSDFKDYMQVNNMVLYGTDADNTFVFNMTCSATSFSSEISDFYDLSDDAVLSFADGFIDNKQGVLSVNGIKYVICDSEKENDGAVFSVRQYITVRNNNLYVLTFNIPSDTVSDDSSLKIEDALGRVSIIREQNYDKTGTKVTVFLLIVLIAVIAVVAGTVIFSLVKDIKNKNN